MKIFASPASEKGCVFVRALLRAPSGARAHFSWIVRPGESLFGYPHEELMRFGAFEVSGARSRRYGSAVVSTAGQASEPRRAAR